MPEIAIPALVRHRIRVMTLGLERPDELVIDTPAGAGLHRRLRGAPRWGGTVTFEMTDDPAIAGASELLMNEWSAGWPGWLKLSLPAATTEAALRETIQVEPITEGADAGRFAARRWRPGLAPGQYVGLNANAADDDGVRLHQIADVRGNGVGDETWTAGDAGGKAASVRLIPDIAYTGTRWLHPPAYVRAYVPDAAAVYHQRRSVGVLDRAIHGPWTTSWSEVVGAEPVAGAPGSPAAPGGLDIPLYASLAALPDPADLVTGALARVAWATGEAVLMMVDGRAAGARRWICIGGTSADLCNEDVNVGRNLAGQFRPVAGTWDYRFPFFMISFGGTASTPTADTNYDLQWVRIASIDIANLTPAVVGAAPVVPGRTQPLEGATGAQVVRYKVESSTFDPREYVFGRTATDGILVSIADLTDDTNPLRIRGVA